MIRRSQAMSGRHGFVIGLGLLIAFRFFLVQTEDIYGSSTEYDALWYVWWMAGYNRYLIPVMPLTSCFFVLLIYRAIAVWRGNGIPSPVSNK